jgi:hypothetical protein
MQTIPAITFLLPSGLLTVFASSCLNLALFRTQIKTHPFQEKEEDMNQKILTLCLGMGVILLATQSAFSLDASCAEREIIVSRLAETYGETRQSMGLSENNAVVEVFASGETGSWTITVTLTSGLTCLIASGQAFEPLDEDVRGDAGTGA